MERGSETYWGLKVAVPRMSGGRTARRGGWEEAAGPAAAAGGVVVGGIAVDVGEDVRLYGRMSGKIGDGGSRVRLAR